MSKKTVTKRYWTVLVLLGITAVSFGVYAWYSTMNREPQASIAALPAGEPHTLLKGALRGHPLQLEKVSTPKQRELGLSGRTSLAPLDGMLFLFPKDDVYSFWMKDMHFPIDILWLDGQMRIIGWAENVAPESYPDLVASPGPARNVLELKAGMVKKLGLQKGDVLELFADTIITQ